MKTEWPDRASSGSSPRRVPALSGRRESPWPTGHQRQRGYGEPRSLSVSKQPCNNYTCPSASNEQPSVQAWGSNILRGLMGYLVFHINCKLRKTLPNVQRYAKKHKRKGVWIKLKPISNNQLLAVSLEITAKALALEGVVAPSKLREERGDCCYFLKFWATDKTARWCFLRS